MRKFYRVLAAVIGCVSILSATPAMALSESSVSSVVYEDTVRKNNTKTDLAREGFRVRTDSRAAKAVSQSEVYMQLRDLGFTHNGACGIMGNIQQESSFNPRLVFERKDGSGGYYGLCQWSYNTDSTIDTEKKRLIDYCSSYNLNYASANGQLDFIWNDLKTGNSTTGRAFKYTKIWNILKNASSTPEVCASVFCVGYERCVGGADTYAYRNLYWPYKDSVTYDYQQLEKRISYANQFSDKFKPYKSNWSRLDTSGSREKFKDVKSSDYFANAVSWGVRRNITSGMSNDTFVPNSSCTRAQVAQMLTNMERLTAKPSTKNPFNDVKSTAWYYDAVMSAYENGAMNGTSKNTFKPNVACTRAELCQVLYALNGSPKATTSVPFKDVSKNAWYYDAVRWAYQEGVVSGKSASVFAPNENCTRAQLITVLYNYTCKS